MICPHCGSQLSGEAKFCSECGTPTGTNASGEIVVRDVTGTGIVVGHGSSAHVQTGLGGREIAEAFAPIYAKIESRAPDPDVDKEELASIVRQVHQEVAKGDEANANKIQRWLKVLGDVAPDILQITVAALVNPAVGVATAVQKVAKALFG